MKESSSVSRTWDLRGSKREGHVEEYWPQDHPGASVGCRGGGMGGRHVERAPDYGRALPSMPESRQVPGWKKAGNLVPYLVLKRAGASSEKGMCLPPVLFIN